MREWIINYETNERVKQCNLKILLIVQIAFSAILIISYVSILIASPGVYSQTATVISSFVVIGILVALSLAFIFILRQMQKILRFVRITEDNIQEIGSVQRAIKISLVGMFCFIIWNIAALIYIMGDVYLEWHAGDWIWAIYACGNQLAFGGFCILLGFKGRENDNARPLCNNCVKPGLIEDSQNYRLFNQDSESLIQMQGK